jgi:hypothetical protein
LEIFQIFVFSKTEDDNPLDKKDNKRFFFSFHKTKMSRRFQKPLHFAWSVMFSKGSELCALSEGSLFIAIRKVHSPPTPESYQAILGVVQKGVPVLKVSLYDSGPVESFQGSRLTGNLVMITQSGEVSCVVFESENEADICHRTISVVSSGNLSESDRLFGLPATVPNFDQGPASLFPREELSEQVMQILKDPTFPSFVCEIESVLMQYPRETAALLSALSKD